jgi:hypothetical protein
MMTKYIMTYREAFVKRANTHQTHFEDLVLLGPDGIAEVKDKIEKFLATSAGQDVGMNTTTKIDGAPAVICYSKFPGYPDNSICLKSFVANANNVISTEDEIMSKYGDRPSMAEKLVYCLQLAQLIPEGEAWQGDCLFSTDDKKVEVIRGKEYITFQPNKIVYAFSEDNPGYEDVKRAEFGIAFHTVYKDDGNGGKTQSFRPETDKVPWPDWAYIMSPALNVNKDKFDIDRIKALYQSFVKGADELCADPAYKDLVNNEVFMGYWNTFENASLADKKETQLNCETVINDLKEYIAEKQTKEFQKKFTTMKTAKGKMGAIDKWAGDVAEIKEIINYSRETIVHLVEVLNAAAEIKMMMWEGFKASNQDYSTFYKSRSRGIIDANMEGVAMSDADGNIVKIVDRSEFSSANRDPDIMAGWEHPQDKLKESYYSSSWSVDDTEDALEMIREFAEKHHTVAKLNRTRNKEAIVNIDGSDFYCTIALGDCVNLQENINYDYHIFISGKKLSSRKDWWGFTIKEFEEDFEAFDSVYHFAETGLKESKDWHFQFNGTDRDVLNEGGVGKLSIDNLNYKNGEYIEGFKNFISEGKPLRWATSGTGDIKGEILIEKTNDLFEGDNEEFANKLKAAILAKEPKAKWVEKPKSSSGIGSQDITINTDFQEAIQGYLFEHYWDNPLQKDSDYVNTLFSEEFKERIDWEVCTADFEKFKSDISTTLTNKGYASSQSWLSFFIAIAKTGSSKIQALYKEGHKLQGAPKAFARGLHCGIDAEVNDFFSKALFGKPKDRVNKADILLVFGPNPEQTAKEYIDACLSAANEEEYSGICDVALSNGTVLGLSLKKGVNEVHAELLATTTSINKDVFGDDAATAIMYYGEEDPQNTFASFKKTCNTPELMSHIENFKFVPYLSKEDQEGLTAQIYLPVNEPYHKEFSDCIKIGIRTNDREKAAVTVEAYKKGAKSGLGKWPTVMQEELGVSLPPKSRPDMSNYERCVEKINTYLSWFKMIYENPKSDYIIGKIASSGGYPLANKETGETKLITAPIIKIS